MSLFRRDEVFGIMERAVQRGLVRRKRQKLTHIGVDEKAFKKGHSYMTVVCDHTRHRVLEVYDERDFDALAPFWRTMKPKQRAHIEAVSMCGDSGDSGDAVNLIT